MINLKLNLPEDLSSVLSSGFREIKSKSAVMEASTFGEYFGGKNDYKCLSREDYLREFKMKFQLLLFMFEEGHGYLRAMGLSFLFILPNNFHLHKAEYRSSYLIFRCMCTPTAGHLLLQTRQLLLSNSTVSSTTAFLKAKSAIPILLMA
jgi:hypothetical protein